MNNGARIDDGGPRILIETRALTKVYDGGPGAPPAVNALNLRIPAGQFTAIMGPSGSGKSTLLYLIAGLAEPTGGEVLIDGVSISSLGDTARAQMRNIRMGFVFQRFNLLSFLSARDNIEAPRLLGWKVRSSTKSIDSLLAAVGLEKKRLRKVSGLSSGEQQRVAIARALINDPDILLADEPTGNLDSRNADAVLDLLLRLKADLGLTIVMVTHNPEVALRADRIIQMKDGSVERELMRGDLEPSHEWVERFEGRFPR
ncbi:MAG TPA: ABC transporter ATP-binding protein [Terriglobia bacterium]|nr:ABC transporter ATP-binding protein [Terriglobia bacterium]